MRNVLRLMLGMLTMLLLLGADDCQGTPPVSDSGVKKANVEVQVQASGLTIEQENVQRRLLVDNVPGSIKHFYVISPISGQALLYSTVKGKVTSSGKRLTPTSVAAEDGGSYGGIAVHLNNKRYWTGEVLQDDGTYGSSVPYIFWWDVRDIYHQHFFTGGQILHLSDQPMPLVDIVINIEAMYEESQ